MSEDRAPLPVASGLARVPGPPPRKPPNTVEPDTDAPPTTPTRRPSATPSKPTPTPSTSKPSRTSNRSTGGTRETSLSLPVSVREALRAATANGPTNAEVILTAVENNAEHLAELVRAEVPDKAPASGLFPDRAAAKVASEPRSTAPLLTTEANLAVLDDLQVKVGATSRSQLVSAALRAELITNASTQAGSTG
ncbi:hypothetical protein GCM10009795_096610 [Nocardioides hankookensis]